MTGSRVTLVAATANRHKLDEISAILGDRVELLPRPAGVPDVDETEDTLVGNAMLKADAIFAATGCASIADDTGLEVDALGGAPGVHSARYAGPGAVDADNVALLLTNLNGLVDAAARRARFRTCAVLAEASGHREWNGVCEGTIALAPRGVGGFGYDPVFVPDEGDGRTFAEMSAGEKHAISHRGRAFRMVAESFASEHDGSAAEDDDGR